MINLDQIEPTEKAKARALAAGLNLDDLRDSDPAQFKLFLSEPCLLVSKELKALATDVFFAAFRQYELSERSEGVLTQFKSFPALSRADDDRYMEALGRLREHPKFAFPSAYVRTVSDEGGKHNQFLLPLAKDAWSGELNQLVGPFESSAAAESWLEAQEQEIQHDVLKHAESWFIDFF